MSSLNVLRLSKSQPKLKGPLQCSDTIDGCPYSGTNQSRRREYFRNVPEQIERVIKSPEADSRSRPLELRIVLACQAPAGLSSSAKVLSLLYKNPR